MFSKDSVQLSDSVDYIMNRTGEGSIKLIFDTQNINNVYIYNYYDFELEKIHFVNYNLQIMNKSDFFSSHFFERDTTEYPNQLYIKYPFVLVSINTRPYSINMKNHEGDFKWIKEGDIYGGW